jgi:cytochrome c biogenesis protein CcmG/thiol:disulfide interchange protein DsbE
MNSREFVQIAVSRATRFALHFPRVGHLLLMALSFIAINPVIAAQSVPSTLAHHAAPNFSRQEIRNNKTIRLDAFRGKVVLLNFWATWCAPCLTEMPAFSGWQKQYGSRTFQVIGVSMDDEATNVVSTVNRLKLNYPVLMGDEHLGAAYGGVLGLPVTFLIDRHGRVQARYENADLVGMKRDLKRLLDSR